MSDILAPVGSQPTRQASASIQPVRDGMLAGLAVWAAVLLSTLFLYQTSRDAYVAEVHGELARRAALAASFVDGDLHRRLVSAAQGESAEYRRAVAPLVHIAHGDPQIRFLYTVVLADDRPHFVLDATPPGDADGDGVEDHSAVMELYEDPDPEMLAALLESRVVVMSEPRADRWGPVLSAYAPFGDRQGQPVGIVGVDITASHYEQRLGAMRWAALAALAPATFLAMAAGIAVYFRHQHKRREIMERELAGARLEEALTRFENLVESAPLVAIQGFDRAGRVLHWNAASRELYGYSRDEATGRRVQDLLLTPETAPSFERILEETWTTGRHPKPREWSVRLRDGQTRCVLSCIFPVITRGSVAEVFCMDVDISDRKHHEERLTSYAAALALANQALKESMQAAESATFTKSAFLANMSHEIRTPMTAILGFTQLLLDETQDRALPAHWIEALQTIDRNGKHLIGLINDILDLSKIEAGKLDTCRAPCSPIEMLQQVAALVRVQADAKSLPVMVEWQGPAQASIQTDSLRLRQILLNLASNAVKFTPAGSVRIVGSIERNSSHPAIARFDVIDTGIGMSGDEIAGLFKPFSQADASTSRRFGGTGLGLAISKRLAFLLGGDIAVASAPGQGSTFTLRVEAGPATNETFATGSAASQSAPPALPPNARILLAEDGPDNQQLIRRLLTRAGAEVAVAEDGLKAYTTALAARDAGHPFDLILMDMQMPELDGYQATRRLRDAGYAGPVVALTAHAMAGEREKCLAAGCDDYATKPIDRTTLLATVACHISSGR